LNQTQLIVLISLARSPHPPPSALVLLLILAVTSLYAEVFCLPANREDALKIGDRHLFFTFQGGTRPDGIALIAPCKLQGS